MSEVITSQLALEIGVSLGEVRDRPLDYADAVMPVAAPSGTGVALQLVPGMWHFV